MLQPCIQHIIRILPAVLLNRDGTLPRSLVPGSIGDMVRHRPKAGKESASISARRIGTASFCESKLAGELNQCSRMVLIAPWFSGIWGRGL